MASGSGMDSSLLPALVRLAATAALVVVLAGAVWTSQQGAVAEPTRTRHRNADGSPRYTNRLATEPSPYLRQHAHNPVDWYPWGDEAFAKARAEGKPIFLSIGYSTCHWCHVMEEESFDDEQVAAVLNERYVAIKVDREQRPDVDAVYMTAVQAMGHGGGWPLTVWLTPDRRPFYGGTYFPPHGGMRGARLGLLELLGRLDEAYRQNREQVAAAAADVIGRLERAAAPPPGDTPPDAALLHQAIAQLAADFDAEHGGFGGAPKFPSPATLELLLRYQRRTGDAGALDMVVRTLDAMAAGGIHDQLAGGFHRYATDAAWRVPHFEKMLYDNALLATIYLEASQATGRADLAGVTRRTLDWLARDMTAPDGGFYAAVDADSEGAEGRFYLWTRDDLTAVLDPSSARQVAAYFGVSPDGPVDGRSVLHVAETLDAVAAREGLTADETRSTLDAARERLLAARARRAPPHTDRKVIVAWNGLAISAFARAGQALAEPAYLDRARGAAAAILRATHSGRLPRSLLDGVPGGRGYLEDYAFFTAGLLDLFEATGDPRWLQRALTLQEVQDAHFQDPAGGYFRAADDAESLLVREKPDFDGAEPSGNSVALENLLRLHELTGDDRFRDGAERLLRAFGATLARAPQALPRMLCGVDFFLDRPKEIVLVTPPDGGAEALLAVLRARYVPNRALVVVAEGASQRALAATVPLVAEKTAQGGRATAYVCERRVCQRPTSDPEGFARELARVTPLS
jgi:uncharacterized protein YyaL (SSP411 family)